MPYNEAIPITHLLHFDHILLFPKFICLSRCLHYHFANANYRNLMLVRRSLIYFSESLFPFDFLPQANYGRFFRLGMMETT